VLYEKCEVLVRDNESTKIVKARREETLIKFLEDLKTYGTWRDWLNSDNELHISRVCRHLGERECNKAWDSTFFRGTGWGVQHKDAFNKWAYTELSKERNRYLLGNVITKDILPSWLNIDGLQADVKRFLHDQVKECKRLRERNIALENQLKTKERRLLELQTELETARDAQCTQDEHYQNSIRTLMYD